MNGRWMWFRIGDTKRYYFVMWMGDGCGSVLVIQSDTALLCEWGVDVVQDWWYRAIQLCYVNGRWMWFRIGDTEQYSSVMWMGNGCDPGLVINSGTALLCEWAVDEVQDWWYRAIQLCYVNGRLMRFRIGDTERFSFVMWMGGGCGSGLVIQSDTALLCEWAIDVVQDWWYTAIQLCYMNGRWMWFRIDDTLRYSFVMWMGNGCGSGLVIQSNTALVWTGGGCGTGVVIQSNIALLCEWAIDVIQDWW
jgi:hypothetical protein